LVAALLLFATVAHAKVTLRLQDLPAVSRRAPDQPRMIAPDELDMRVEPIVVMLTLRAQQIADPRGRAPSFLPILGTTCIGGSLRLDF
jgi:hypothetical protein